MINQNIKKVISIVTTVIQLGYCTIFAGAVENPTKNINNQTSPKNNIQELKPVNDLIKNGEEKNLENMIIDLELVERMAKNLPYNNLNTMDESMLYLNASRFAAWGFPAAAVKCALGLPDPKERYDIGDLLLNQEQVGNAMKLFETLPTNSEYNLLAIYELYSTGNPLNALKIEKRVKENNKEYFDKEPSLDDIKLKTVSGLISEEEIYTARKVSLSIRDEYKRLNAAEEFYKSGHPKNAEKILWTIQGEEANKAATELYYKYRNKNKQDNNI